MTVSSPPPDIGINKGQNPQNKGFSPFSFVIELHPHLHSPQIMLKFYIESRTHYEGLRKVSLSIDLFF